MNREPYPSDISDEEWAFDAPYLTLMSEIRFLTKEEFDENYFVVADF